MIDDLTLVTIAVVSGTSHCIPRSNILNHQINEKAIGSTLIAVDLLKPFLSVYFSKKYFKIIHDFLRLSQKTQQANRSTNVHTWNHASKYKT